ncbi:hypothetical protein PLICRDRAFT_119790 [Plicaturopsis crispa FD-325 SS-3]|uniref:Unplaced genomic scaffold PLICRscaffold_29, whole genome shotgun sequence n=1 Tax=Plicaturopsis crispa FD-325 SS-3 TaxID=944288 RepID=A0A0C9SVM1_PLICR|nr:hypothetical protein PLICRDRAFT_119790 [Plicaturopsis crispa FD-325 SS-3]
MKFRNAWATGIPLVVTGVHEKVQSQWTPALFSKRFGKDSVWLVNCQTDEPERGTVEDFFRNFGTPKPINQSILKLKDWPTQTDFQALCPELYKDFLNAVPMPDYTRPDGIRNLASYFDTSSIVPDLGPKLYIAHGTRQDDEHSGSTRLHTDITDAVNMMMYAGDSSDGSRGFAVWHIFRASDSDVLRSFLSNRLQETDSDVDVDPIHGQNTYMTPSMIEKLQEMHGIKPYVIMQFVGDAVFIPAGCPHQVRSSMLCM